MLLGKLKISVRCLVPFTMLFVQAFAGPAQAANTWQNKRVINLLIDSRSCVFFQLDGVAEADHVVPNNAWFSLPKTAANYQEMHSWLLSAKLSGTPMTITTDGTISCGLATVTGLWIP